MDLDMLMKDLKKIQREYGWGKVWELVDGLLEKNLLSDKEKERLGLYLENWIQIMISMSFEKEKLRKFTKEYGIGIEADYDGISVGGNTYPVKDILKENGFKWDSWSKTWDHENYIKGLNTILNIFD